MRRVPFFSWWWCSSSSSRVGKGALCCCRLASRYVFASGRTPRVKTASHLTLRIPYLDGPQIGNPVELLPKSDFIQNGSSSSESYACCVRCWTSPGRAHSHCPFVYFSSLCARLLKERRQYSRLSETRLSRYIRKTIIVTLLC